MKPGRSRRAAAADVDRAVAEDLAAVADAAVAAVDLAKGGNRAGRFEHLIECEPRRLESGTIAAGSICGVK
jgi:hypothetical protein